MKKRVHKPQEMLQFKNLTLFILLFSFALCAKAQDDELDSIKLQVKNYQTRDTTRVHLLLDLTRLYATGDVTKNLPLIEEALDISEEINYQKGKGLALNTLSKHYVVVGELDKALRYALDAISVLEQIDFQEGLISTYNNLARIYNVTNKYEQSLEIHLKNIELVIDNPPTADKAGLYFYAGKTYSQLKDLDNAEKYYLMALNISKEISFQTGIAIAEGSLASVYNLKKEYPKAIEYLEKTLQFAKQYNQISNIAAAHYSLAGSYQGLRDYRTALKHNSEAIRVYEELKNYRMLNEVYSLQSNLYEAMDDYENANAYLKKHYAMMDTIFSESKTKVIEELQTKYETDKKEAEIELLSQQAEIQSLQIKQQRYMVFGLSGAIILLFGGSILIYKQRKLKQQNELTQLELSETQKRLEVEQQYRSSELKALRSQMNPHFVFNALNSIQEFIVLNEKKLAGKYLGKFADLMRTYLNHSQKRSVTIDEETSALDIYLQLEKLRFEDSLNYSIQVDDKIDTHLFAIPSLLIQPYVENALKHGLLHLKGERNLSVSFQYNEQEDTIQCEIEDNGIGRKASAEINKMRNPNHKSFATEATKSRLELLNHIYEKSIGEEIVDLEDEDGKACGTKVVLIIPVLDNDE